MSDMEEQKSFYISLLISIIFSISLMFCVCYFVVGFGNIWNFFIWVFLTLITYWYITLPFLAFFIGVVLLCGDSEYYISGGILLFSSLIIFLILAVYGGFQLKKEKENMQQEQTQAEIVQSEKE